MKRVFISRALEGGPSFKNQLEAAGFQIQALSLLDFSATPFEAPKATDWVFFYSKKALKYFWEGLSIPERTFFQAKKIAAFGEGTRFAIEQLDLAVHFVGTGSAVPTAEAFLEVAAGASVLFPRAENSRKSVQKLLSGKLEMLDLIVYKNVPRANFDVMRADFLVFTSPLNAQTYYSKYALEEEQVVLAIGTTTAKALKAEGVQKVMIPDYPSEEALAKLLLQLAG